MGIKDLHTFIREKYPQVPEAVPVLSFKGYRIAVDVYGLGYILMAAIRARYIWSRDVIANPIDMSELELPWLKAYFDYILPWLKAGITPVFVFDGPNKGIKTMKMEKDRAEKEAKKAELDSIMQSAKGDAWKTDQGSLDRARKLLTALTHIPAVQIETLKNILQSMKFPVVQAPGDGETVCSALCKAGYVAAVFSADGDNLAHGCPVLIRDKADVLQRMVAGMLLEEEAFSIVRMSKLLDNMNLTQAQFTDFCIMCGCDYNQRIPGIGPVKSLDKIREHGCIERIPLNTSILNHLACRQEFTTVVDLKALEIDEPGALNIKGWDSMSSECMASYNLETLISDYRTYIQRLPVPKDFHHPPSLTRIVIGDFDELEGIVPLPKQEKKSKYAKKSASKKKEKDSSDWRTKPVMDVPGSPWMIGAPIQNTPYYYPNPYMQTSSTRFVIEDDEISVPQQAPSFTFPIGLPSVGSYNGVSSTSSMYNQPYNYGPSTQMYTQSHNFGSNTQPYISSYTEVPSTHNSQMYSNVPSTPNSHIYANTQSYSSVPSTPGGVPLAFPILNREYSAQTPSMNPSASTPYKPMFEITVNPR